MLNKDYVDIIVKRKDEILKELNYSEEVIRDDIFKLLRRKSKVIFFHWKRKKIWTDFMWKNA